MPLIFSLMEINGSLLYKGLLKSTKSKKSILFSDFFSVKMLANPYKIKYIQKAGLIGALYDRG